MSKRAKAALAGGVGAVAIATATLIQPWEGREYRAYRDMVGVWTICDGDTENVRPGQVATDAECDARTKRRVYEDFYVPIRACVGPDLFDRAPVSWQAAATSLSYNIGVGAFCGSTAVRRAKISDWRGSCEAMTLFNRAGGKVVTGLKLRREFGDGTRIGELELCLAGLDATPAPAPVPPVAAPKPAPAEPVRPLPPPVATAPEDGVGSPLVFLGVSLVLLAVAGVVLWRRRRP